MKRFLFLLMACISGILSHAQSVVAYVEIDGIYYNIYEDNTCQVSRNGADRYKGDMIIPETVIHQGTTYTVTSIGYCQADDLTSVSIPKTVSSISKQAFEVHGTTCSLENYYVAEDNPIFTSIDGVIYNKKKDLLCRFPHGRKGAYRVLDNTLQICYEAFCGSVNLTEITLPASFEGFTYPEAISYTYMGIVGPEFTGCNQLKDINMDPSGKEWGYLSVDGVLYHCANTGFVWGTDELAEWVGSDVWYVWTLSQYPPGRKDETYHIAEAPDICNVLLLESLNASPYLQAIENAYLPYAIRTRACYNCSALTQMDFTNVFHIEGYQAFCLCENLKSVDLSHSPIHTLFWGVFQSCSALEEILFPNNLEEIEDYAFHGCKSLKNVTIPANVRHIGVEAFGICDALENLTVETGNLVYDSREDCNAIIETATNTIVQGTTHTIIPESVTIIGENSFYDYNIKEFTIPANIERIESNALRFNYPGEGEKISYISMRPTPPSIQQNSLFWPSSTIIHVLPGCKEAYQQAEVWCNYTIVDDAGQEETIQTIEVETDQKAYNLFGHHIDKTSPAQSIFIKEGKKFLLLP